jgi:long-chain acyl-CoA synthetase
MTTTTARDPSTEPRRASGSSMSLLELFRRHVTVSPDRPALRRQAEGEWQLMSWREYGLEVDEVAAALVELGLQPGERVGILSGNRVEWHVADMAVMSTGAVTVPVYQTSSSSQVAYVLGHSNARFCFVENLAQLAKLLLRRGDLPEVERIFLFDHGDGLDDPFIDTLDHVREIGVRALAVSPEVVAERRVAIQPEQLATLVYTSGTTGPPKGTMISHDNIMAMLQSVTSVVPVGPDDRFLSFLPLSHIAERVVSHFGQILSGGETWFAQSLASVPDDLRACRPTIFFAVPRVWEKFQEAVVGQIAEAPKPLQQAFDRYLVLGQHRVDPDGAPSTRDRLEHALLDQTLGRRLRSKMGLDHARVLVSAAAPIHVDLLRWFAALGLHIGEAYGQTEGTGVTSVSPPDDIRIGTVGRPAPGVRVRIADDGEILVKGDNVAIGYLDDEQATAELIDDEGWMHTGDLGALDEDGFLSITGRKKDLIINAAGKNIAPQEIETALRYEPLISQAVVVGDQRPYLVALLTLDVDKVAEWATAHGKLGGPEALRNDPDLLEEVQRSVDRVNAKHSRVEGIKRWQLLPHDLSVDEGELTPTLKVKRQVVTDRFAELVDQLYAG